MLEQSVTVVLAAYVGVLGWGPSVGTPYGLVVQVIAQKTVAIAGLLILVSSSIAVERRIPAR